MGRTWFRFSYPSPASHPSFPCSVPASLPGNTWRRVPRSLPGCDSLSDVSHFWCPWQLIFVCWSDVLEDSTQFGFVLTIILTIKRGLWIWGRKTRALKSHFIPCCQRQTHTINRTRHCGGELDPWAAVGCVKFLHCIIAPSPPAYCKEVRGGVEGFFYEDLFIIPLSFT